MDTGSEAIYKMLTFLTAECKENCKKAKKNICTVIVTYEELEFSAHLILKDIFGKGQKLYLYFPPKTSYLIYFYKRKFYLLLQ